MTNGFTLNHNKGLQIYFCEKWQAKNTHERNNNIFMKYVEKKVPVNFGFWTFSVLVI